MADQTTTPAADAQAAGRSVLVTGGNRGIGLAIARAFAANGDRGAEALADIADTVFAPIVEAVHGHGGYVAEFGGDAILGIFPGGSGTATTLDA